MFPLQIPTGLLNFVVAGPWRGGTTILQTVLSQIPRCVCHSQLLFADSLETRKKTHEEYFGTDKQNQKVPEFFVEGEISPWQYLNHNVFDRPLQGEKAVGVQLLYPTIRKWELWDLFAQRCNEGDFCLIHVVRNPVACFVSYKQAEQTQQWTCFLGESCRQPLPVHVDLDELVTWCREQRNTEQRIREACSDCLSFSYRELYSNYIYVLEQVLDFLELPEPENWPLPKTRRLKNRHMRQRISNFSELVRKAPSDVRQLLANEDLF